MTAALAALRVASFLGGLVLLAWLEQRRPRRPEPPERGRRWPANLGLGGSGMLLVALLPVAPVATALWAQARGLGLGPLLGLPPLLHGLLSLLVLDLAIYAQHRALHELPRLWPLHRVHHADVVLDVSTGLRFHPLELLLSQLWKCSVVLLLGAPPLAVLAFEILLGLGSLWTHANLDLPERWDRRLRHWIVTPDVHRVHHSVHREEHDRNYGTLLLVWDRLFGSYRPQPAAGHLGMRIGLRQYRSRRHQVLPALLRHPWMAPEAEPDSAMIGKNARPHD